jgi:hypothetical protein
MYCYRFPDRDTFVAACGTLGWLSEPSEKAPEAVVLAYTHDRAIDEIGPVQTTPGTYDEEGVELTAPAYAVGHHINFIGTPPEEWEEYQIKVDSPNRTFAGSPGPSITTQEINELRTAGAEDTE